MEESSLWHGAEQKEKEEPGSQINPSRAYPVVTSSSPASLPTAKELGRPLIQSLGREDINRACKLWPGRGWLCLQFWGCVVVPDSLRSLGLTSCSTAGPGHLAQDGVLLGFCSPWRFAMLSSPWGDPSLSPRHPGFPKPLGFWGPGPAQCGRD